MTVNIQVSEEIYRKAEEIAEAGKMSVGEVFESALADQVAQWERLKRRAAQGNRDEFLAILDKVPPSNRTKTTAYSMPQMSGIHSGDDSVRTRC